MAVDSLLGIPLMENGELTPEVFYREFVNRITATQRPIIDKDLATPPGAPADQDQYIVAATATDEWVGHENDIARWDEAADAWLFMTPVEGITRWVADEDTLYTFDGADWVLSSNFFSVDTSAFAQLAGRAGGQILKGGTASGENLTLRSTNHATLGKIMLGLLSAFDETNVRLGIGTDAPTNKLEVHGEGGDVNAFLHAYGGDASDIPRFIGQHHGGTIASPTPTVSGRTLVHFGGRGRGTTVVSADSMGRIRMVALEDFTDAAQGTGIEFIITPIGSVTPAVVAALNALGFTLEVPQMMKEIATPATPPAGYVAIYPKSDGKYYILDDAGTETELGAGGGGGGGTDILGVQVFS